MNTPVFFENRVVLALQKKISVDDLTADEQEEFFDELDKLMDVETPEQIAFFKKMNDAGLGVGLDDEDNLVYGVNAMRTVALT